MEDLSKVYINSDNILEVIYAKHITIQNQTKLLKEVVDIINEKYGLDTNFGILVDTTNLKNFDDEARILTRKAVNSLRVNKVAVYGTPITLNLVKNTADNVKKEFCTVNAFTNKTEAITWIKSNK